jgi:hypothetical protein
MRTDIKGVISIAALLSATSSFGTRGASFVTGHVAISLSPFKAFPHHHKVRNITLEAVNDEFTELLAADLYIHPGRNPKARIKVDIFARIFDIELRTVFVQPTYIFLVPSCYLKHQMANEEDILDREPRRL